MESPPRDMLAFLREMHPRVEVDEGGGEHDGLEIPCDGQA